MFSPAAMFSSFGREQAGIATPARAKPGGFVGEGLFA
jgi:hypothetical protein